MSGSTWSGTGWSRPAAATPIPRPGAARAPASSCATVPAEGWRPQLYVVPLADIGAALERRIAELAETHPGLGLERGGGEWRIVIPDALRIGHDAHFRELTKELSLPQVERGGRTARRERANLLAKYFVTTAAEAAKAS